MAEENKTDQQPEQAPVSTFQKLKDDTKDMVNKILSFFRQEKTEDNITVKSPTTKILKGIHKLLVEKNAQENIDFKADRKALKQEERDNEKRNNEILKILSNLSQQTPEETKIEPEKEGEPKKAPKRAPAKKGKAKPTAKKAKVTTKGKPPQVKPKANKPSATKTGGAPIGLPTPGVLAGVVGAAALGLSTSAVAAAESGGDYNITFGDRKDASGKIINSRGYPTPEDLFHKKLTDMTLAEVKEFGRIRNSISPNSSATGAYQFMNSTLFGNSKQPGLVQQAGLSMDTKYNKDTQELLYALYKKQNADALTRSGVPITPGFEYMSHYIGAGGTAAVYRNKDSSKTVAQVIVDAGYREPGKQNNPELYTIKAVDFEKILADRVNKKSSSPHSAGQVGATVDTKSKENSDMKKDAAAKDAAKNVTYNNVQSGTTNPSQPSKTGKVDDTSPYDLARNK